MSTNLAYDGEALVCQPCPRCPNNARVCAPTLALAEIALAAHVAKSHAAEEWVPWGRTTQNKKKKAISSGKKRGRPKGEFKVAERREEIEEI